MPESAGPINANRAALVRLLSGGPNGVSLDGGILHIGESGRIPASAVDAAETGPWWFWTRLTVHVAGVDAFIRALRAPAVEHGPHRAAVAPRMVLVPRR